ncbi:MAG: hypothetical protein P8Z50_07345 [candidate division WOR-3 bacterium]
MKTFKVFIYIAVFIALAGYSMNMAGSENEGFFPVISGGVSSGEEGARYDLSETENDADVDAVTGATKAEVKFTVLAGGSYGGLVHNENMHGINGVSGVDAITGATKVGSNAGFETHQLRLPVTYNFGFFKNDLKQTKLVLKVGLSAGYTFSKTIEDSEGSENLPEYDFSDWDLCGKIGVSYYPFNLNQNSRFGIYIDAYRGFKAYKDIYHEAAYLGGNAFMRFGFIFEP